ncbi:SHOCT domain-containing protein [Cyanobacterium aponinum FACHB-4101]|uniref:NINE protein n=1 Tax=Cyanobacterium aponinum TaxID=379064 RepID=UPI001680D5A9|nr:NINE protein [Cyanobacterium aponinum]MBD2395290.1 SHOCT domain-containing protein [Cyanobacterium aponinum FACHB-4101]
MVSQLFNFYQQPKKKIFSVVLALIGTVTPLVGLHKLYLGQPLWGLIYFILSWESPMARIACAIDAVLYLAQDSNYFHSRFNPELPLTENNLIDAKQVTEVAQAIRELEKLRQDGLISENEFEQKRRKLIA